ncbi:alpha/beta fold hydrolase [Thalassotalea hakodatensis]|uniref:alpha/beta fold hydrolase n=1 Tax=Thalassotalea hakodatensis TaxID=3030492 RepID=UPI0025748958|nr:alpha/beta hydrolase [Thalassotalea hakodatensis]
MQPLFLLPGTMCDERLWQPTLSVAENHFIPHFLTLHDGDSIDEIVQQIATQLPKEPVNLLGFSLGGYLASAFAIRYPEKVSTLFIVSNIPCALPVEEVKERSRTIHWIKKHGYRGIPKKRILNLMASNAHDNTEVISLIAEMDKSLGGEVLMAQLRATTQRVNLFEQLRALPIAKHFCVGREDTLVNLDDLQRLASTDEKMDLTIFEHTGHMLPLEQPKAFSRWLNNNVK